MLDFIGISIAAGAVAATTISIATAVASVAIAATSLGMGEANRVEAKEKAEDAEEANKLATIETELKVAGETYAQNVEVRKHAAGAVGDAARTSFFNQRELEDQSGVKDRKTAFKPTAGYPSGQPTARA